MSSGWLNKAPRTACAVLCVVYCVLGFEPTRAAPALELQALRTQLAGLPASARVRVPQGALDSITYTLDTAERITGRFKPQSQAWLARARELLEMVGTGKDPARGFAGRIWMRGYRSAISEHMQGYAIYVPKDYDPARRYPLLLALHGGSANGNLFLGVVLGNNMNWKEYAQHLWDQYEPRWSPDFIVVAPDGFGHVMWRFMGEQDVLDVIADVQRHYSVDADRVALSGLSNGGVGAYNLGLRHASRFSYVGAIAGAPSWLQYGGGAIPEAQRRVMAAVSGMQVAENAINTDFRYYHGRTDGGPMKPRFVTELTEHIKTLGVPFKETWFDAGHDLLYLVHRHGRIYNELAPLRRKQKPTEVRVQTGDYRASTQHWLTVTRIDDYPSIARVRATAEAASITVETRAVRALSIDLRQVPLAGSPNLTVRVDGVEAYSGPRAPLGDVLHLLRGNNGFRPGLPESRPDRLEKKPKLSGPITDAYYDAIAHVYGTQDPAATEALKKSAERGAQGWPLWLWRVQQKVLADTAVTDEILRSHHLVLYATPGSHALLERIASKLPVKLEPSAVVLGARRFEHKGVGVKLIYPNPLAADRYVIVQASPTTAGVEAGNRLPDFLPDYVVYDAQSTHSRPRLVFAKKPPAMGYFDDHWLLRDEDKKSARAEPSAPLGTSTTLTNTLPPQAPAPEGAETPPGEALTKPLPAPAPPSEFAAPASTQAGRAAREIAKRVQRFPNYRSHIRSAVWRFDPLLVWSIRDNAECLRELEARGVRARSYDSALPTPVATPVEVLGAVAGVAMHMIHAGRTLLMSCELAAKLPALAQTLRAQGVKSIDVMSAYRDHPFPSFHTLGLALDISRFTTEREPLIVRSDFEKTPDSPTCDAKAASSTRGQALRDIACALAQSRLFSSVLTPNYNVGHHDHFHVDIRPDDPRAFLR